MMKVPSSLVTTDWLHQNINHPNLIIFDASMAQAGSNAIYQADIIIYGAQRFDFSKVICDLDSSLPNTMPSVHKFQDLMQNYGVNQNSCIVVYDQKGIYSCARAWWMLKSMGFDNVAVLDGGLPAWLDKSYSISNTYVASEHVGNFIAQYDSSYFIDVKDILAQINISNSLILDARSKSRFLGENSEPRSGMRSGHIPNAKSLPFTDIVKNGFMSERGFLQEEFNKRTDEQTERFIFCCGSGVTACILALGAALIGYDNLAVYDGSWSEWGASNELPVEIS
ncbi:sulfurtransferase [Pseudoalteromonas denitrificans]|uniref:Thiosulfate/3-mercaptopyruvate sulfurtransferase n=1 Tax=Pseudoalteromonas denitrificans DSM 6059 TaxID=1123010 RepID=A0A1I1DV89_9GAMM|nr:sulfurtransferase [Pseudoalteromonas denitrificans]SFB78322.1 thiosulfate/3-mercaptopyruvate sulfurtransferase [Pseudoalteromonas denitrificans DSM 6059]